jgi:hypothetical protein
MIAIGIVVVTWTAWGIVRLKVLSDRFERVQVGDSREQVMHLLGKPRSVQRCPENPGRPPGCVEEYLYASPFAPLLPEYWSVLFDRNGHVVGKEYRPSP